MNIIIYFFYFFFNHMPKKTFWIANNLQHVSEIFFIAHKDNIIFLLYDTKKFRIAQKFSDSNATLLSGFFSLRAPPPFLRMTTFVNSLLYTGTKKTF